MKLKLFFILIIFFGILVLFGCGKKDESKKEETHTEQTEIVKLSAESIKQIKLETEIVKLKSFTGYLSVPAKVITNQDNEAQVGSLIQGRVHQIFVKVGDYVKAGQTLLTVEGLDVGAIKAGFLKAKATLDYSKATFERQKKLFDDKIGSQKALLESQAEYEKALAEYKAEDKRIHSVGLNDEDVTMGKDGDEHTSGTLPVKSHLDGIVIERNVVVGQFVDASTNAFKVINTNTVWIDGQIYEKDLAKINNKTSAVFTTMTYPNEKFIGRIIYTGQTVDEQSRTITVRGEFSNPDNKLKPQMFGDLKFSIGSEVKSILLPVEALVKDADQSYLFISINDTTFGKRVVTTGSSVDDLIEITSGLNQGESIVSKGIFYLKSELKKEELSGDEH
ncbi:MAG: efflux RND transporter periplasmic adaptor subunit [Ignavibacteriales bacterium]|nr:efflux RND transporter periplasmic adaptor subunit [Ignavibacteriales bacterium]